MTSPKWDVLQIESTHGILKIAAGENQNNSLIFILSKYWNDNILSILGQIK